MRDLYDDIYQELTLKGIVVLKLKSLYPQANVEYFVN